MPVRATHNGNPLLLPASGSLVAAWLAASPRPVRVSLPAGPPFAALRLTGRTRPVSWGGGPGIAACSVAIDSIEFTGRNEAGVPVADYRAAAPDPLWRVAPGVLHHLEHGHMAELVRCVRAHGMTAADWVVPRGLDRYGLELLVFTADGVAAVRLSFPDGPVTSLDDVPVSVRAALTCRCHARPGLATASSPAPATDTADRSRRKGSGARAGRDKGADPAGWGARSRGVRGAAVSRAGPARSRGGLADDQLRLEDDLLVPVAVVGGGFLKQHPRRGAAELLAGLADRGERDRGGGREVDVVVADDRDVLGHPDPVPGHLLQEAQRDQVVGAEPGGGAVRRPPGRRSRRRPSGRRRR